MSRQLFANFLHSSTEYDKAVEFWVKTLKRVLKARYEQEGWCKWFNAEFVDGTPDRDGNPIASFVSRQRDRGIKIVQLAEVAHLDLEASVRVFARGDTEEIPYLEMWVVLTPGTAQRSKRLIKEWVNADQITSLTGARIRQLCKKK
jgi:hypothetical protein